MKEEDMRAALVLIALCILVPSESYCRTWTVRADESGDAPTIQAAIDSSSAADTVLVEPGTYYENIDFLGKQITVKSTVGPDVTTIDGSSLTRGPDNGSVVVMGSTAPSGSVLSGFRIQGGTGTVIFTDKWGGGILCHDLDSEPPTNARSAISFCIVTSNTADNGGGIAATYRSSGVVFGCEIIENTANSRGAGMWFNQLVTRWDVENCEIDNNTSHGTGGGIQVDGTITAPGLLSPYVTNTTIVRNSAGSGEGGGVYCRDFSAPVFDEVIIAYSLSGGGVYCAEITMQRGNPSFERVQSVTAVSLCLIQSKHLNLNAELETAVTFS